MSQGLERQDVRLDRFLRGQLRPEVYERVVTSEPCVIISPEERRVHRYAVLGHRCLFLTAFPPKILKPQLQLEDIISIKVVRFVCASPWQYSAEGNDHSGGLCREVGP